MWDFPCPAPSLAVHLVLLPKAPDPTLMALLIARGWLGFAFHPQPRSVLLLTQTTVSFLLYIVLIKTCLSSGVGSSYILFKKHHFFHPQPSWLPPHLPQPPSWLWTLSIPVLPLPSLCSQAVGGETMCQREAMKTPQKEGQKEPSERRSITSKCWVPFTSVINDLVGLLRQKLCVCRAV